MSDELTRMAEHAKAEHAAGRASLGDDMMDAWHIAVVRGLRHRAGSADHTCKCEECVAIRRVCALALEALLMKRAGRRSASPQTPPHTEGE